MNTPPPQSSTEPSRDVRERVRRLLKRASSRAALPYVAVALAVIVAVVAGGREIEHHITAIESWIAKLGPWGVLAFVALFIVATSCLFPDTVLCIVAGALFGVGWGFAAVVAGNTLAAAAQFALSRKLLKNRIDRTLVSKPSLAAIQRAVMGDEFRLQVLLRLTPLNPATISYLLGAAGVRFRGFVFACIGNAPALFMEVYFGHAGKHASRVAGGAGHPDRMHDITVFGGLAVGLIVMVVVSKMARQALAQAVGESGAGTAPPGDHGVDPADRSSHRQT